MNRNRISLLTGAFSSWMMKKPVQANLITGTSLGIAGDVICQFGVEQRKMDEFDVRRFLGISSFSGIYASTFSLKIFALYPKILPDWIMKSALREGIASSLLDCCIHSPLLYLPSYYYWMGTFEKMSFNQIQDNYKSDFALVMQSLLFIWIPVQAINFSIVPRHQRVLFVCGANLVWNVVIDLLSH